MSEVGKLSPHEVVEYADCRSKRANQARGNLTLLSHFHERPLVVLPTTGDKTIFKDPIVLSSEQSSMPEDTSYSIPTLEVTIEVWKPLSVIGKEIGITSTTLRPLLNSLEVRRDRGNNNQQIDFYRVSEVIEKVQDFLSRPQVDKNKNVWTDDSGEEWAAANYFRKKYGIDNSIVLSQYLNGLNSVQGRSSINQKIVLYKVKEVLQKIGEFISYPLVDKESGRHLDENQKSWVGTTRIAKENNLGRATVLLHASTVLSIKARGLNGRVITLYDEEELLKILKKNKLLKLQEEVRTKQNSNIQFIIENLTSEKKLEILDQFGLFLDQNPDTTMSILDFAEKYIKDPQSLKL